MPISSSSVSRSPSSTTCASALIRSSPGAPRRSRGQLAQVRRRTPRSRRTARRAAPRAGSARTSGRCPPTTAAGGAGRLRGCRASRRSPRPAAARRSSAIRSTAPRAASRRRARRRSRSTRGPQPLDDTRRERLRHQAADAGVVRRLHVEDPVVGSGARTARATRGGARAPCPRGSRCAGTCGRAGGRAAARSTSAWRATSQWSVALVVHDRGRSAELVVDRVRVGDEAEVGGREVRRRTHGRTAAVQERRGSAAPTAPTVTNPRRE